MKTKDRDTLTTFSVITTLSTVHHVDSVLWRYPGTTHLRLGQYDVGTFDEERELTERRYTAPMAIGPARDTTVELRTTVQTVQVSGLERPSSTTPRCPASVYRTTVVCRPA